MIYSYSGSFPYNRPSVQIFAPGSLGVYYCGYLNVAGTLICHYVGRAIGEGVTIRSRLVDHFTDGWPDVTHFGHQVCTTAKEAEDLEKGEIKRLQPKYNKVGKGW